MDIFRAFNLIIYLIYQTKFTMSANLFQKAMSLFLIGGSALFIGYQYFSGHKVDKQKGFKIRQQLLKKDHIKMLYSTISFFYLFGFKSQSIENFFQLNQILEIEKPDLVVVPLSQQIFAEKYAKVMAKSLYKQSMDNFIHCLKTKDVECIKKISQFDLKNLQKLYIIDHCMKLKTCKVIYGRRPNAEYRNLQKIYKQLKQKKKQSFQITDMKVQDYIESIVHQMNPKVSISILPQAPYKMIIGLVEPELMERSAMRWKQKMNTNFNHQVLQDEEVLKREEESKKM